MSILSFMFSIFNELIYYLVADVLVGWRVPPLNDRAIHVLNLQALNDRYSNSILILSCNKFDIELKDDFDLQKEKGRIYYSIQEQF